MAELTPALNRHALPRPQPTTPAANWPVMGIDLGTTNSCVGVWRNGRVEIVPSDQGSRTTPSCVAFTDSERLIGEGANHQVATNASNTVFDVKRLMGRSSFDASVQSDAKYWPFGVIEGPCNKPLIRVIYLGEEKEFSPEEISAMVLVKMKETAEAYVGEKITNAVISVPAYFNGFQRQATKDAGVIAGLNVLRIINEPTAAAIAYAHNRTWTDSTVLVYDLGGGKLDVSLVVVKKDEAKDVLTLQVKATAGDTHLGGEDFTNIMVDHFVNEFKKKNPDVSGDISSDKKALGCLQRSCEEAKRRLSTNPRIQVEVAALFEGIDFQSTITRDQFQELNNDLFRRCMEPIVKVLYDAKMDKTKLDDVVLVGGCTRIPHVQQLVQDFFNGHELCRNINSDEAVAYGATLQAAMLMLPNVPQVVDITPFSQGIGMLDGTMWEVIARNATIPTTKETPFISVKGNQSSLEITVYEDEREMTKFPIVLDPQTKVSLHIDQDGILQVWAQDKEGSKHITTLVGSFSKEVVDRMVKDAQKYKAQDGEHKKNVQARDDLQRLSFTIINNMKNLKDSAAGLIVHPETTREPITKTPGISKSLRTQKSQDKGGKGMIQAHNDTIKKLQDGIRKLKETVDETTNCLEDKEHSTSMIVDQKKQLEEEYESIIKQIQSASQSKFN